MNWAVRAAAQAEPLALRQRALPEALPRLCRLAWEETEEPAVPEARARSRLVPAAAGEA